MRLRLLVPFVSALAGCTLYFGDPQPGPGPGSGWGPDAGWVTVPDAPAWYPPDGGCCPPPTPDANEVFYPDAQPTCGNDAGQAPYPDAQPIFFPDAGP
ncbi:MAG: hypothetical protein K8W52_34275 [Deltaproteobacteria bacterium]|nr:hypothetical protein [Deltaproteobacteria bacterium]